MAGKRGRPRKLKVLQRGSIVALRGKLAIEEETQGVEEGVEGDLTGSTDLGLCGDGKNLSKSGILQGSLRLEDKSGEKGKIGGPNNVQRARRGTDPSKGGSTGIRIPVWPRTMLKWERKNGRGWWAIKSNIE
ncbi:hypothetical protein Dimus_030972 [Dionaea muscipula]